MYRPPGGKTSSSISATVVLAIKKCWERNGQRDRWKRECVSVCVREMIQWRGIHTIRKEHKMTGRGAGKTVGEIARESRRGRGR